MKIEDLRIGNYLFDGANNIHQVSYFDFSIIGLVGCSIDCKYAKPIAITGELLLRLGFKGHHDSYYNDTIYIKNINDTEFEWEWGVYPNELGSGIQIKNRVLLKYIHQLQNLHLAITGEELNFKSK
jgi:hypothetical protein